MASIYDTAQGCDRPLGTWEGTPMSSWLKSINRLDCIHTLHPSPHPALSSSSQLFLLYFNTQCRFIRPSWPALFLFSISTSYLEFLLFFFSSSVSFSEGMQSSCAAARTSLVYPTRLLYPLFILLLSKAVSSPVPSSLLFLLLFMLLSFHSLALTPILSTSLTLVFLQLSPTITKILMQTWLSVVLWWNDCFCFHHYWIFIMVLPPWWWLCMVHSALCKAASLREVLVLDPSAHNTSWVEEKDSPVLPQPSFSWTLHTLGKNKGGFLKRLSQRSEPRYTNSSAKT